MRRYEEWRGQYAQGLERARTEIVHFMEESMTSVECDLREQLHARNQEAARKHNLAKSDTFSPAKVFRYPSPARVI